MATAPAPTRDDFAALLQAADERMYAAKAAAAVR